ncbi:GTPase Era [Kocuria massiliensis]|uniref:GTPase Era n=1 Tax=Kocuria massiliensis TaxID=1926282 RepID=UPI000A1CAA6C|nr:GTPase Era [Kocuria massiliensis]
MEFATVPEDFVAGFAVLVGRPNAGKSTLTNALVGRKVAITSNRPQTTRHTIRGIVHSKHSQLILIDTPGLHRPRTLLGERLNDLVAETLAEVDVIGFCIPADEKIGPGDRYIASQLAAAGNKPIVAIVTKSDKVTPDKLAEQLVAVSELGHEVMTAERKARQERLERRAAKGGKARAKGCSELFSGDTQRSEASRGDNDGGGGWADVIPVSAVQEFQVEQVGEVLSSHLPESPPLYPDGDLTDEPEAVMVGELVREAALEGVRDELPHSVAVTVEEMMDREDRPEDDPMIDVHVNLYVERDSQKAIIIGKRGARLRDIGTTARQGIEALLGTKVYLSIHVKVAKDWQRDPRALRRLGF